MNKIAHPAKRWIYLALGTLTMLCIGTLYGWSVLKVPLAETFGWEPRLLTAAYSFAFIAFCLGNILGSRMKQTVDLRIILIITGVAIFSGYTAISFLTNTSVVFLYLYFSLLVGGGMGLGYPVLLDWIGKWFPDRYGLCSGILTMGFGTSALLLVRPVSSLFSVSDIGWRGGFRILGLAAIISVLICVLVFRDQPAEDSPVSSDGETAHSFTTAETLRHPSFWLLYVYLVFNGITGTVIVALAYDYCTSLQFSASVSATLVGIVATFNGASRIIFGRIYDRLGRKATMTIGSCCVLTAGITLLLAVLLKAQPLAILGLVLAGLGYGYGPVVNPILIRAFFGPKHFAMNYSFSNTRAIPISVVPTAFATILVATGSFVPLLAACVCCSLVAICLQRIVKSPSELKHTAIQDGSTH